MVVPKTEITANVKAALAEDIGTGDLTADLIDDEAHATAQLISREHAILAGVPWFDEVFKQLDPEVNIAWDVKDGDAIKPDTVLCKISGPAKAILTGERTAINFLQTLSGTATIVATFVDLIKDTHVKILDTRKNYSGIKAGTKICGQLWRRC